MSLVIALAVLIVEFGLNAFERHENTLAVPVICSTASNPSLNLKVIQLGYTSHLLEQGDRP